MIRDPLESDIERVVMKLVSNDFQFSDQDLMTLLWIMNQHGPAALEMTFEIEHMVRDVKQRFQLEQQMNPVFNTRLLPIYDWYMASLHESRMNVFYRISKALLQDSELYSFYESPEEPPEEFPYRQLELVLVYDDF